MKHSTQLSEKLARVLKVVQQQPKVLGSYQTRDGWRIIVWSENEIPAITVENTTVENTPVQLMEPMCRFENSHIYEIFLAGISEATVQTSSWSKKLTCPN